MKREFILNIDEDILLRFNMALQLNNENCEEVCEAFMKRYFLESFSKEANAYRGKDMQDNPFSIPQENYFGKALNKISKWAKKPNQINHRIIKAFLMLSKELPFVTYNDLLKRCTDEESFPEVYATTFTNNFNQMKFDSEKSHGKIFEVDSSGVVTLWDYIENEIIRYEGDFMKGQSTALGYLNKNNQRNIGKTNEKGTDHCSVLYMMRCEDCGHEYFANSTDIHLKKCPNCQGGADTGAK